MHALTWKNDIALGGLKWILQATKLTVIQSQTITRVTRYHVQKLLAQCNVD